MVNVYLPLLGFVRHSAIRHPQVAQRHAISGSTNGPRRPRNDACGSSAAGPHARRSSLEDSGPAIGFGEARKQIDGSLDMVRAHSFVPWPEEGVVGNHDGLRKDFIETHDAGDLAQARNVRLQDLQCKAGRNVGGNGSHHRYVALRSHLQISASLGSLVRDDPSDWRKK